MSRLNAIAESLGIEGNGQDPLVGFGIDGLRQAAAPAVERRPLAAVAELGDLHRGGLGIDEAAELGRALAGAGRAVKLLIVVTDDSPDQGELLRALTGGRVGGARPAGSPTEASFPESGRRLTGALAGHRVPRAPRPALALEFGDLGATDLELLMELGGLPAAVRLGLGSLEVLVWSAPVVLDPLRPLESEREFEEALDEAVPALAFFRDAFGAQCWHNPHDAAAIVIDDPLVKKRYGLLDLAGLLESARANRYRVTLAFIPWNHRRTKAKDVAFFGGQSGCFSLCVHGCDHSNNEFGAQDYEDLLGRNHLASRRMEEHSSRTSLGFEPVMVCPQEQYSVAGLRAFADSRQFLGLVNTGCLPRDKHDPLVTAADLLAPAQDAFFGYPVFKRHYPTEPWKRALSLFLGKPAILVTHHGDFQEGARVAEAFAEEVATARPGSSWAPLGDLVRRTHWRKANPDGSIDVRLFATEFAGEHQSSTPALYRFRKRLPDSVEVGSVSVNGDSLEFEWSRGYLRFEHEMREAGPLEVKIEIPPVVPPKSGEPGWRENASTAFRRGLSEFRDTVISRNKPALRTARSFMKSLRLTGGN